MTAVGIDLDARAYELDRAHVFHSWSAQAALNPLVLAGDAAAGCGTTRAASTWTSPARW